MQDPTADTPEELFKSAEDALRAHFQQDKYDSEEKKQACELYQRVCKAFAARSSLTPQDSCLYDASIARLVHLHHNPRANDFGHSSKLGLPPVCALCRKLADLTLATSHIIPDCLLRLFEMKIITPQRTTYVASTSQFKRKLLCTTCEVSFSHVEAYAKQMFFESYKTIYDESNAQPETIRLLPTQRQQPSSFHRFLVSLVWRAMATKSKDNWGVEQFNFFWAARAYLLDESSTEAKALPLYMFIANTVNGGDTDDAFCRERFCAGCLSWIPKTGKVDFMVASLYGCHIVWPTSARAYDEMWARYPQHKITPTTTSITIEADGVRNVPPFLIESFCCVIREASAGLSSTHVKPYQQKSFATASADSPSGRLFDRLAACRPNGPTAKCDVPIPTTGSLPYLCLPRDIHYNLSVEGESFLPYQLNTRCDGCKLEQKTRTEELELHLRTCTRQQGHWMVLCDLRLLRPRLVMACQLVKGVLQVVETRTPVLDHFPLPEWLWAPIEAEIKHLLQPQA